VRVEVVDLGAGDLAVATGLLTFAARRLAPEQMHKALTSSPIAKRAEPAG
jgi:hypothetical protein